MYICILPIAYWAKLGGCGPMTRARPVQLPGLHPGLMGPRGHPRHRLGSCPEQGGSKGNQYAGQCNSLKGPS